MSKLAYFVFGFFAGVLTIYLIISFTVNASDNSAYWLKIIDSRLEYIEKRTTRIEEKLDTMNKNFEKVREYDKIRVKISN
ncbi:MAG: hypothetical protein RMJ36_01615 [Candidatus Calescibacterium sp.]|nr:hypothetical protein [Candidatus Calescibacterium sp.]MDW8132338.1 hypothetical protein [Candidatus Calescibacterium sp.]